MQPSNANPEVVARNEYGSFRCSLLPASGTVVKGSAVSVDANPEEIGGNPSLWLRDASLQCTLRDTVDKLPFPVGDFEAIQ